MKRLVFCFDGTWNKLSPDRATNVVLTAASIERAARDGVAQIIHYDEGVGTGDWDTLRGGMLGSGLIDNVREAYRFLVFNYDPGDEIYVFGFSRGAYSARTFVGFIRHVGPLHRLHVGRIDEALELYQARGKDKRPSDAAMRRFRADYSDKVCIGAADDDWRCANKEGYLAGSAPQMKVKFLGVWDTVGALGVPDILPFSDWLNREYDFHDPSLDAFVESARHAVAIDERRELFPPVLFGELTLNYTVRDDYTPVENLTFTVKEVASEGSLTELTGASAIFQSLAINRPTSSTIGEGGWKTGQGTIALRTKQNASGVRWLWIQGTDPGGLKVDRWVKVDVTPVADTPQLTVPTPVFGNAGAGIALTISGTVTDIDGSEAIASYQIDNVPDGFLFGGRGTSAASTAFSGKRVWTFAPSEMVNIAITPPANWWKDLSGSDALRVRTTAVELSNTSSKATSADSLLEVRINGVPTDIRFVGEVNENVGAGTIVGAAHALDPDVNDSGNRLDISGWGSYSNGWSYHHGGGESQFISTDGPTGQTVTALRTGQFNGSADDVGGGVGSTSTTEIDPNKAYRFTVFVRPEDTTSHLSYFGLNSRWDGGAPWVENASSGGDNNNPYFIGNTAQAYGMQANRWYRIEGYVLPRGHQLVADGVFGGVFDVATGQKVGNTTTYRWNDVLPNQQVYTRFFNYYGQATSKWSTQWHQPAIEEVPNTFYLSDTAGGRFQIDNRSGLVTATGAAINYEATQSLSVGVGVRDAGQSLVQTKSVKINDVNETPYNLVFEAQNFFPETTYHSGNAIARFTMADQDFGPAPALVIVDGNPYNWFRAEGNHLYFNNGVHFSPDWIRSYRGTHGTDADFYSDNDGDGLREIRVATLTLAAQDAGGLRSPSNFTYNVFVEDVNEAGSFYNVSLSAAEGSFGYGTSVPGGAVGYIDPDFSSYHWRSFSDDGSNPYFRITEAGQVQYKQPVNYEQLRDASQLTQWLNVTMNDYGVARQQWVSVQVADVNDAPRPWVSRITNYPTTRRSHYHIDPRDEDDTSGFTFQVVGQTYPFEVSQGYDQYGSFLSFHDPNLAYDQVETGTVTLDVTDKNGYGVTGRVTFDVTVFGPQTGGGGGPLAPVFLDMDGDGVELISAKNSGVLFDMDGDGVKDETGWVGADDAILVHDFQKDGVVTSRDEFVFGFTGGKKAPLVSDLEGLRFRDTNSNGWLDEGDNGFAEFKAWRDANSNAVVDTGEMRSLVELGIHGIKLEGQLTGEDPLKHKDNTLYATSEYLTRDGRSYAAGDVFLAYKDKDGNEKKLGVSNGSSAAAPTVASGNSSMAESPATATGNISSNDTGGATAPAAEIAGDSSQSAEPVAVEADAASEASVAGVILEGTAEADTLQGTEGDDTFTGGAGDDTLFGAGGFDTANYSGAIGDYALVTRAGGVFVVGMNGLGEADGTDALYSVEKLSFTDGSIGLAAPIVLDLNDNGVKLKKLSSSFAHFDMNGDGSAERTAWISRGDGFLVLDRNKNGAVDDGSEISFVGDKPGAKSDLDGLSAFDTNGDQTFSKDDQRFADFQIWRDRNGNGRSDEGELKSLSALGIASIALQGDPTDKRWKLGAAPIVNHITFTRDDGRQGEGADALFSFSTMEKTGKQLLQERRAMSFARTSSAERAAELTSLAETIEAFVVPNEGQRPPADASGSAELDRLIEQMAAFGGANDDVASADSINWRKATDALHFGLITASGITG